MNATTPSPLRRSLPRARLLVALSVSLALHAGAALATGSGSPPAGGQGKSPYAPLETRLVTDTAPPGVAPGTAPGQARLEPAAGRVDNTYYKPSQLETRTRLVTRVDPVYPSGVPPTGGKSRVLLFINERGFVDRVNVVESTPIAKFGEAAASAFRTAQFSPGKRGSVAVKTQIMIEVEFHPLVLPTRKP